MDPPSRTPPGVPGDPGQPIASQAPALITPPEGAEPPLAVALRHAVTRGVLLAGFLVAVGLLFHELVTLVAAGVITIIFAMLFSAVAAPLERRGVPRAVGAFAGVLALFVAVGGLLALVVPPLAGQVRDFARQLPSLVDDLAGQLAALTGGDGARRAGDRLERNFDDLVGDPARFLGPLAEIGLGLVGIASALAVILITAYFMAARPQPLVAGVLRLLPPQRREWGAAVFERLRQAWTGWMRGVLIDMLVTGTLLYAGLSLIGLDYAIMFAALSALLVVVPYFGAIVGGVPPVLLALTESTELGVLTLAVYLVVQQLESNVIVPLVMARQVKLHPAVIAIGVVVVSQLFGLVGVFVAVPLAAAFVILVEEIWVRPLEQRRGIAAPDPLAVERGGDGRWRRLRRERLEREDAHRRGGARLRGEDPGAAADDVDAGGEGLTRDARRFLIVLGAPALALSLAITTVTTYVPVLINEVAGAAVTGALIGAEGLFALLVPVLVGGWSDQVRTRIGRRMPFLLGATPVAGVALVAMPAVGSLLVLALALLVFYVAYFAYYAPYRALFPDLVRTAMHGRSQGIQNTMREVGLGAALVGGGVLLGLWRPLPFLLAALVLALVTVWFVSRVDEPDDMRDGASSSGLGGVRTAPARVWSILRRRAPVRRLILANVLLEATVAALKTFVVLYITVGLGRSMGFASLALGIVAAGVIAGALVSGRLADRIGHLRILKLALPVYAVGLALPVLSESPLVLAAVPFGAAAAGIVMTLPYSMLMGLMPEERHGAVAGVFESGRGVGVLLGPVAAGIAVELSAGVLPAKGFSAAFAVAAVAALAALPLVWRLSDGDAATQRG